MSNTTDIPPVKRDPLDDPTFIPCRDERCGIEGVHREHAVTNKTRGPSKKGKSLHA